MTRAVLVVGTVLVFAWVAALCSALSTIHPSCTPGAHPAATLARCANVQP